MTGLAQEAGAALVEHPGIDHFRSPARRRPAPGLQQAAAKRHCPVTLELGGKSPQIVFADADLDAALPVVINAIVQNAGQTCSAGSRLLVEQHRATRRCSPDSAQRFAALRVGPHSPTSIAVR